MSHILRLSRPSTRLFLLSNHCRTMATNASGLTPAESRALKERAPLPHEEKIAQSIKEMYGCNPTPTTFSTYHEKAVFHDPIGYAEGVDTVRAQFVGLAKLFEKAEIPKFKFLENPSSVPKSTILIDQDVTYYRKASEGPTKTLNSLLTVETNAEHQVTRHTEEWNHNKQTDSSDGFFGTLNEWRKKMTTSATHMAVGDKKTA